MFLAVELGKTIWQDYEIDIDHRLQNYDELLDECTHFKKANEVLTQELLTRVS
jgi:hypothetical protein